MVAAACHSVVSLLFGWQWRGERAVVGVPWRFGAVALQHHWQQGGRLVVAMGMPRCFVGRNVYTTAG